MELFLLRHADADTPAERDDERQLSDKGKAQAVRVARFCEDHELAFGLILSSPICRAHQTARIVADHLQVELMVVPWLACGMTPSGALEELGAYEGFKNILLVGHEPDFSCLAAHLLGLASNSQIRIRKASLTGFEVHRLRQAMAHLLFSIPCRMM